MSGLTWMQRRELERELWVEEHLDALADVRPEELDEPGGLAALETRARMLADVVARLRRDRGDQDALERDVIAFRGDLEQLG
jgi:hypothetical protein